ncbi:potassium channel family protein [soil metagenome]
MITFFIALSRFARGLWYGFKDPEFKGLFTFVILLLFSGTVFYNQVEHWRIIDSFYFTVTTLSTVGFGDFAPKTDLGKIFTTIYILTGVGTLLGFVNIVAHHSKENDPIHQFFVNKSGKEKEKEKEVNS